MIKHLTAIALLITCTLNISCKKNNEQLADTNTTSMYFPPVGSSEWQSTLPPALGWNETELINIYPYLESKGTKAFIILKNGRIVTEKYFGNFTADSTWYWASAGKTLTAFLVGIAQSENLLNISNKTSQYIGTGWTSAPLVKENLITVRHQLTMTTGLDDGVSDNDCTLPSCLNFKADAGTRWAYHNAAYTLLDRVIENASGTTYNAYFKSRIRDKIGMNGLWIKTPDANNVYYSNARSMARFGLLMLSKGRWQNTVILPDTNYFNSQINTSQNLNLSYGYLTWLNGKASSMVPMLRTVFPVAIVPAAPADMYAALGKNDQKIYVVPSQNLVVIRMGNSSGTPALAMSGFDSELWTRLKAIIKY